MEKILALNIKNNLVDSNYFAKINKNFKNLIVFPSNLQIIEAKNQKILNVGLQNVQANNITLTGEISIKMLKQLEIKYCIVGHSERRINLKESLLDVYNKTINLLKENITPILCIGELKQQKNAKTIKEIDKLLNLYVKNKVDLSKIILAYEPIFCIGTGNVCSNEHISFVVNYIKSKYNFASVLYGGSVNESNCKNLLSIKNIDGFLVGGASLSYEKVNKMIEIIENK